MMLVAGLKRIFGVDDAYLNAVGLASFVVFCILGVCYVAPKLKRIEFGEEARYTSVWASRVGIVVGAWIGTVLSFPVIDKVGFLRELPHWLAVGLLFVAFVICVFVFSECVWTAGPKALVLPDFERHRVLFNSAHCDHFACLNLAARLCLRYNGLAAIK